MSRVSKRRRDLVTLFAACAALLALSGCSGEKAPEKPGPAAQAVQKPKADFSGVVRGIVKLAPDHELPLAPPPATKVGNAPAPCPPYSENDRKLLTMVPETRGISPVHVALTQMTAVPEHKPATRELTIDGCRVQPPLTGAMHGDTLRIVNRSDAALLPVLPGDTFMKSLAKGEAREVKLSGLGPVRIGCGLSGYCGEAVVISLSHPLFAVTSSTGEFEIRGVPLDQDVTVHAGHPLVGVTSTPVRLTKAQPERTIELTLTPQNAPAQAAEPDAKAKKDAKQAKAPELEPPK